MYIRGVMHKLVQSAGMTSIDLEGYYFSAGEWPPVQKGRFVEGFGGKAFVPRGYLYGPIRTYVSGITDLDAYKVVLMLRDPRDVLTSLYFTTAYNHYIPTHNPAIGRRMEARRQEALRMTIDQFVLDEAESSWIDRYTVYCEELLHRPNVLLAKYEDMVSGFPDWLDALVSFLDIEVNQGIMDSIIDGSSFRVDKENVYSNKRQVLPGDHKRKLQAETIQRLTMQFDNVLSQLGYL
jgi:hypothetical protein